MHCETCIYMLEHLIPHIYANDIQYDLFYVEHESFIEFMGPGPRIAFLIKVKSWASLTRYITVKINNC